MYKFKIKRFFFWKTYNVIGHQLHTELNRMDLFLPDGSLFSISQWDKYDLKLGTDWVLATKKKLEEESNQQITLRV